LERVVKFIVDRLKPSFLGVLCVIIGAVLLTSAWVLTHILVGGEQEADGHHVVLTPHPLSVPLPLFIFLFFGGIGLVIIGVLWLCIGIVSRRRKKGEGAGVE
jgi:hypothetical protein